MDQWLVRTANNILAGPYSRDQVVSLIQEGKLGLQDEVCQANHYWIFLHEHVEVENQLGIHMPRAAQGDDDEITETQTDAVHGGKPPVPSPEIGLASLPQAPQDYEGGTAVLSRGTIRDAHSSKTSSLPPGVPLRRPPLVTSVGVSDVHFERSSIWKSFAWLMVLIVCLIVFAVLRLLHSAHPT